MPPKRSQVHALVPEGFDNQEALTAAYLPLHYYWCISVFILLTESSMFCLSSATVASASPAGHWVGSALPFHLGAFHGRLLAPFFSCEVCSGSYAGRSWLKLVLR